MVVILIRVIKIVFLLVFIWIIYKQLTQNQGITNFAETFSSKKLSWKWAYLAICFLLMPINWYVESKKWQLLMSPFEKIGLNKAFKTILAGISLGFVTPARIGEYGGRLITSDPNIKPQVITATLLGSISQNGCNIAFGLLFSYYFLKSIFSATYLNALTFTLLIGVQIVALILIYFNLPKVAGWINALLPQKLQWRYKGLLSIMAAYNRKLLVKVLSLSGLRYGVYFIQYLCIMYFLGINSDMLLLSSNIAGIYLVQTGIPLPAFLSIFARGELAIFVWGNIGIDHVTALMATFCLWFINLIIPAVLGFLILFNTNIKRYFFPDKTNE